MYASWNGATEVKYWRLEGLGSPDANADDYDALETVAKDGFEAKFHLSRKTPDLIRVAALDVDQKLLGLSDVIHKKNGLSATQPYSAAADGGSTILVSIIMFCILLTFIFIGRLLIEKINLRSWFERRRDRKGAIAISV